MIVTLQGRYAALIVSSYRYFGTTCQPRNVGNTLPINAAQHPRRTKIS